MKYRLLVLLLLCMFQAQASLAMEAAPPYYPFLEPEEDQCTTVTSIWTYTPNGGYQVYGELICVYYPCSNVQTETEDGRVWAPWLDENVSEICHFVRDSSGPQPPFINLFGPYRPRGLYGYDPEPSSFPIHILEDEEKDSFNY